MFKDYDLTCKFDLNLHKQKYPNYLEVLISPDGKIVYAVPSHMEKLIEVSGIDRDELQKSPSKYIDLFDILSLDSGYISVWNERFMGYYNKKQLDVLKWLKDEGEYKGNIPKHPIPQICFDMYEYCKCMKNLKNDEIISSSNSKKLIELQDKINIFSKKTGFDYIEYIDLIMCDNTLIYGINKLIRDIGF